MKAKGEDEFLRCVEASRYYTPEFESRILQKFSSSHLRTTVLEICRRFELPLPSSLKARNITFMIKSWLQAFQRDGLSQRDFARLMLSAVGVDENLKQRVLKHAFQKPKARAFLTKLFAAPSNIDDLSNGVKCWRERDEHHRQQWNVIETATDQGKKEWKKEVEKKPTKIFVSSRLANNQNRAPAIAALMCSFPESKSKFLFRCRPLDDGCRAMLSLLSSIEIISSAQNDLKTCLKAEFGLTRLNVRPFDKMKKAGRYEAFCEIARRQNRSYCRATDFSPIFANDDIDGCRVYHMALELDLLSTA